MEVYAGNGGMVPLILSFTLLPLYPRVKMFSRYSLARKLARFDA
jgi:hypothetical protein